MIIHVMEVFMEMSGRVWRGVMECVQRTPPHQVTPKAYQHCMNSVYVFLPKNAQVWFFLTIYFMPYILFIYFIDDNEIPMLMVRKRVEKFLLF